MGHERESRQTFGQTKRLRTIAVILAEAFLCCSGTERPAVSQPPLGWRQRASSRSRVCVHKQGSRHTRESTASGHQRGTLHSARPSQLEGFQDFAVLPRQLHRPTVLSRWRGSTLIWGPGRTVAGAIPVAPVLSIT